MKNRGGSWTLGGAIAAGMAASLCCLGPLLSLSLGLGSFTASAFFARWRPWLLALTCVLLAGAWYLALRPSKTTCDGKSWVRGKSRATWAALSLGTIAAMGSAAYPWWAGMGDRGGANSPVKSEAQRFSVSIPTMDCAACANGIAAALRRAPGVLRARVNYDARRAEIVFDPAVTNRAALLVAIDGTGFSADRATLK